MGKIYHMVCHKPWYTTSHVQFLAKVKKSYYSYSLVMQLKSTTQVSNTLQTNLLCTLNKVVDQ